MKTKSRLRFFSLEINALVSNIIRVCKSHGWLRNCLWYHIYHYDSEYKKLEAHWPSYQVQDKYLRAKGHIFSYSLYCVTQCHVLEIKQTNKKKGSKAGKIKLNLNVLMFLNAAIQKCSLIQRSSYWWLIEATNMLHWGRPEY